MQVIVVRGGNGVLAWRSVPTGQHTHNWVCSRDSFTIPGPVTPDAVEPFLLSLANHSQSLLGSIAQVVELDV